MRDTVVDSCGWVDAEGEAKLLHIQLVPWYLNSGHT